LDVEAAVVPQPADLVRHPGAVVLGEQLDVGGLQADQIGVEERDGAGVGATHALEHRLGLAAVPVEPQHLGTRRSRSVGGRVRGAVAVVGLVAGVVAGEPREVRERVLTRLRQRAERIDPKWPAAHNNKGWLLGLLGVDVDRGLEAPVVGLSS